MDINIKTAYIFNCVTLKFMQDIKDKDKQIKNKLKTNYKVFDKESLEYIEKFSENVPNVFENENILDSEELLNFELFKDITVKNILTNIVEDNEEDKKIFIYKLYVFNIFSYVYKLTLEEDKKEVLLNKVIEVINSVDSGEMNEKILDEILDDDIKSMLQKVYDNKTKTTTFENPLDGFDMEELNNSKIGAIAKEISESIDINSLNIEKPEELLNINNMFSGSNNVLGDIIGKVGNTITSKIENGEINQEELMNEAFSMMSKMNMGNNNFMSEMMNMMGGQMPPEMKNMNNNTKRRLQRKLENKKK